MTSKKPNYFFIQVRRFFKIRRRPEIGYSDSNLIKKKRQVSQRFNKSPFLRQVLVSNSHLKSNSLMERIVKGLIYFALRIVIKPSKFKDKDKIYDVIDGIYLKIMSVDFIYVPSSIAFYIIMAFMPITSLVLAAEIVDWMRPLVEINGENSLLLILGKFIPGVEALITQLGNTVAGDTSVSYVARFFIISSLIISVWISSGGFSKLVFTQSHLYGHRYVGGYWMNRIKGMVLVVFFTLYLIIALSVNVGFEHLLNFINLDPTPTTVLRYFFLSIGLSILIVVGFGGIYRYSPRFRTRWRYIMPGVITTSIPTAGFLILFGSITSLWSYSRFGTIGAIMYVGMASLIITYFVFVGILVNAGYHKAFVGRIQKKFTVSRK